MAQATEIDVFVAGGGLSGALVVANLLRAGAPLSIVLAERSGDFFRGVAYGTRSSEYLLNVPAGKMSAFAADPEHFLRWVRAKHPALGPGDFAELVGIDDKFRGGRRLVIVAYTFENCGPGRPRL